MPVWLGFVLLVAGMACAAQPVAAESFSLADVSRRALATNEAVLIAAERLEQARIARRRAYGFLLPTITIDGSYTRRADAEISSEDRVIRPETEQGVNVRLDQPLYSGGRAVTNIQIAARAIEASGEALAAVHDTLLLAVATAFYEVLRQERTVATRAKEVTRLEEHRRAAAVRFEVGEVTRTVVLRAQAELERARAELIRNHSDLQVARVQLRVLADLPEAFTLVSPAQAVAADSGGDPVETALARRADLAQLRTQEEIADLDVRLSRATLLPELSFELTYDWQRQDPESFFTPRTDRFAALRLTFAVFEGFRRVREIGAARSRARAAELATRQFEDQIRLDLRRALLDLEAARAIVTTRAAEAAVSAENYELVAKQFAVGQVTQLDLLDASTTLADAERELAVARFDEAVAAIRLARELGQLHEALVGSAEAAG